MKNLYLLYGGKSTEHEISVLTAKSVINNLDRKKYKIFPIYVDKCERKRWMELLGRKY